MWEIVRQPVRAAASASVAVQTVGERLADWLARTPQGRTPGHVAGPERSASERSRLAGDRGDVPGWVLITLMTAGLVVILWAAAGSRLESLFDQAMDSVTGPGG